MYRSSIIRGHVETETGLVSAPESAEALHSEVDGQRTLADHPSSKPPSVPQSSLSGAEVPSTGTSQRLTAESQPDVEPMTRAAFDDLIHERELLFARELSARDQRVAKLEQAYRETLRDKELATVLASRPLLPGAAAQLVKLWSDQFEAFDDNGEYKVQARDGRSINEAVDEWLAASEYAHFCQPSSRGGAQGAGANRVVANRAFPPRTLGDAVVMRWQEAAAQRTRETLGPVGLGRRH